MRRLLISSLLALSLAAGAVSAQQFSSLEERMSAKEFREAGLDKLSPEELARLNQWLSTRMMPPAGTAYAPAAAPAAPAEDRRGFLRGSDDTAIVSTIPGEFRGWRENGDRFTLANGQVWQVSDMEGPRFAVKVNDPTVTIEPGALGAWYLSIDGYNARVQVRRIK